MQKVLVIDDDMKLCRLLADYLQLEGFECGFANDGLEAMGKLTAESWDLVVLDVMMPKCSGFEVLRFLRTAEALASMPVLMLTAKGDELDRISGLEAGADDYLTKPFSPGELAARLRALFRRSNASTPGTQARSAVNAGDLTLNKASLRLTVRDRIIPVTPVEFRIVERLLDSLGQVVSRDDLSRSALGHGIRPFERALDTNISRLRAKLGPHADGSPRIKAVRGEGYVYLLPEGAR